MDLFNKEKIKELEEMVKTYQRLNERLEQKVKDYDDLALKCRVMKSYIDDDEAILELLEAEKVKKENNIGCMHYFTQMQQYSLSQGQQALMQAMQQSQRGFISGYGRAANPLEGLLGSLF